MINLKKYRLEDKLVGALNNLTLNRKLLLLYFFCVLFPLLLTDGFILSMIISNERTQFKEDMKNSRRYNGYYSALHSFGLEYNPDWVLGSNWDEEYCDQMIREAYRKKLLPDAFFVASDLMAIGVLRTLFDLGVQVPSQVAVMGMSNIEISRYSNPPLSTISLPIHDMGRVAAGILFNRIEGDDTPPKTITLSAEVLKRSST